MNKVTILIFALAISYANGACSAALGTYFGVTISQPTAPTAAGSELPTTIVTCKSQENTKSCCLATEIAPIKTDIETLKGTLETSAGNRDKAILAARAKIAKQKDNYAKWLAATEAAKTQLNTWETTPPTGVQTADVTAVKTAITKISGLWTAFFTDYATNRNGFPTYQKARATCITELLKDATAAKCLSCVDDQSFTTYGISGVAAGPPAVATIAYDNNLLSRMVTNCLPYFTASKTQTQVFLTERYAAGLEGMTTALTKIAAGTSSGIADFTTAATPATATGEASTIDSATCLTTGCNFITGTVFVNGKIDPTSLIRGGTVATRRVRLLAGEQRMLAGFNPLDTEAKFTIAFAENPGSVTNVNDLSALRVGVFSCIVAFFVALLI